MHIYVTVLNTDIGFICHLRRAVYRSTGLHGPKEDDDDDDDLCAITATPQVSGVRKLRKRRRNNAHSTLYQIKT